MAENFPDKIIRICAEAAGIDLTTCDQATRKKVRKEGLRVALESVDSRPWDKPGAIESEIDGIIADIRSLRRRIQALDNYALALARMEADRPEREAALQAMADAGNDPDRREAAHQRLIDLPNKPKEDWVDFIAIRHLDELEAALVFPATEAITRADRSGRTKKRNLAAYDLALAAAHAYQNLTGKTPGNWTGGNTPFMRMVEQLFEVAGIRASVRKPIEAAIHNLRQKERD